MFKRYLPTLILKKQQLQAEIRLTEIRLQELMDEKERLDESFKPWLAVFGEKGFFLPELVKITRLDTSHGNIAGVSIPIFNGAEFEIQAYDFIRMPLWLDLAAERMKQVLLLDLEAQIVEEQRRRLSHELRITTQRVNLFEKIKIPETKGNIKKSRSTWGISKLRRSFAAKSRSGAWQKPCRKASPRLEGVSNEPHPPET
jgi:V/A-type H+-transporting ATPase subunit D